jgi:hypothetical protein
VFIASSRTFEQELEKDIAETNFSPVSHALYTPHNGFPILGGCGCASGVVDLIFTTPTPTPSILHELDAEVKNFTLFDVFKD